MPPLTEMLDLIDSGVDAGFAASLAGLSLAAAAFYGPFSEVILSEARKDVFTLEKKMAKGEQHGYEVQPENEKALADLNKAISSTKAAQTGLIKAFLIFVWFVAYTISIDSLIDIKTAELFFNNGLPLQIADITLSSALLTWAGYNLWVGAIGIGDFFKVDFGSEQKKVESFLIDTGKKLEKLRKNRDAKT